MLYGGIFNSNSEILALKVSVGTAFEPKRVYNVSMKETEHWLNSRKL